MVNSIYELRDMIGEISYRCYIASWYVGIEFELWDLIEKYPDLPDEIELGISSVSKEEIKKLKELAEETNGFWTWEVKAFPEKAGTKLEDGYYVPDVWAFVPMYFWKEMIKIKRGGERNGKNS